jgi:hypothetical protein
MNGISKFTGSLVGAVALVFVAGRVSAQNLVLNPGFETGDLTSWSTSGTDGQSTITVTNGLNGPSAPGSYSAFMDNAAEGLGLVLDQNTANGTASPGTVNYSFDLLLGQQANGGVFFVQIFADNSASVPIGNSGLLGSYSPASWTTVSGSFVAPANTDHLMIQFTASTGASAGSISSMYVDNVVLSQVPEPTTVTLVGLGLFGVFLGLRKRLS